jgi:hypothetical protein
LEKLVRFVYPSTPYRCKECWTRFWKFENPLQSLRGKIAAALMILLVGAGLSYLIWFREPVEPPAPKKQGFSASVQGTESERIKKSVPKSAERMPIFPEEKPLEAAEKQPLSAETKTEMPAGAEYKIPPSAPVQKGKGSGEDKASVKKPVAVKMPQPPPPPVQKETGESRTSVKLTEKPQILPSAASAAKAVQASADASEKKTPLRLKDIRFQASEGGFSIVLSAGAPIEKYKTVALNPPPKLVLDLPGKWNYSGSSAISVKSDLVERIRVGEHDNKLRLVIDLKGSRTYSPRVEPSPDGLIFSIKK